MIVTSPINEQMVEANVCSSWPKVIMKTNIRYSRYVGINVGSPQRADMIRSHWSFTCQCKRCSDPTELGTYASAIWCYECKDEKTGLMLPKGTIPAAASLWTCTQCGLSLDKAKIESLLDVGLRIIK